MTLSSTFTFQWTTIPSSAFLLDKSIGLDFGSAIKNIYCDKCEGLVVDNSDQCQSCQAAVDPNRLIKNGKFFVSFKIRDLLENLLKNVAVQASI